MNFRTEVELPRVTKQLSFRQNALMIGSCFTENIGNYLQAHCFPMLTNPCGILYNPASIASCTDFLVRKHQFVEADLFEANGLWNNFNFHSQFSDENKATALGRMNDSIALAAKQMDTASYLFLTFGSSWIYRDKQSGRVVGNCHKLPANRFSRERLSVEEMSGMWIDQLDRIFELHPELTIVLTISPIRHLRDGFYENQVSKSGLFLLTDKLISHFGPDKIIYFPSYELIMDELRDYRFYATDMLHLSETAIAFVQEKFNLTFLDSESNEIILKIEKIIKSLSHRPFQSTGSTYQDFLSRLNGEILKLEASFPFVNFDCLKIEIIRKKGL